MSLGGRAVWKLVIFNSLIENVCNGCSIAGLAHSLVFAFYLIVFGYHENLTTFWVNPSFSEDSSLFPIDRGKIKITKLCFQVEEYI